MTWAKSENIDAISLANSVLSKGSSSGFFLTVIMDPSITFALKIEKGDHFFDIPFGYRIQIFFLSASLLNPPDVSI